MPFNKTYARRLLKLADFLDKLPPKRFDYGAFVGNDWKGKSDLSCGTTACALGWATTDKNLRKCGLKLVQYYGLGGYSGATVTNGNDECHKAAIGILVETEEQAISLFLPEEDSYAGAQIPEDSTAKQVAKHIRKQVTLWSKDN